MKLNIVIGFILVTVFVGLVVFGRVALESRNIDRTQFARDQLRVLSYSTFVSSFGPGPILAKRFEEKTGVKVELVNVGDSGLIIQKLKEDSSIYGDVILGVDRLHQQEAEADLGWKPLPKSFKSLIRPDIATATSENFVPITWAPLTFIFKKSQVQSAKSFDEFLKTSADRVFSLQDPRLSTPGLQFLFWWIEEGGSSKSIHKDHFRISPSWSQSYGLFKRDVAQVVFTYLTSVIFHWEQENDTSYDFYVSEKGHPWQVELAGVSDRCRRCDDAQKFIHFLLQPENQLLMMKKNYMFPVLNGVEKEGLFLKLPELPLLNYDGLEGFLKDKPKYEKQFFESFQ